MSFPYVLFCYKHLLRCNFIDQAKSFTSYKDPAWHMGVSLYLNRTAYAVYFGEMTLRCFTSETHLLAVSSLQISSQIYSNPINFDPLRFFTYRHEEAGLQFAPLNGLSENFRHSFQTCPSNRRHIYPKQPSKMSNNSYCWLASDGNNSPPPENSLTQPQAKTSTRPL